MDVWEEIREELREYKTSFEFLNNISEVMRMHPSFDVDSLSKGQLYSKIWLIKELLPLVSSLGNVYLLCGWYAIIAEMLFENIKVDKIYSFDIDPLCTKIADDLHISHVMNGWRFKSFAKDVNKIEFDDCDTTVINTSCEHLSDNTWFKKIPEGTLVILQSNNASQISDHINCVNDIEEMQLKYKLSNLLYKGEIDAIEYKRFMLIGVK